MELLIVNKDLKTASPPNPMPKPNKDSKGGAGYEEQKFIYDEAQAALPIYPIRGSMCKSGIYIAADVLRYHAEDKREAEIHEDNSVTLHGPYK